MIRRDDVRSIVARTLAEAGDEKPFGNSDSLLVSGRLSSLDVVDILSALEAAFGLEIDADDFDPIRFDTVDSIVELLGETAAV
ncbi:MAG: acyl carrier protein [Candidatus Binatia bacterium]